MTTLEEIEAVRAQLQMEIEIQAGAVRALDKDKETLARLVKVVGEQIREVRIAIKTEQARTGDTQDNAFLNRLLTSLKQLGKAHENWDLLRQTIARNEQRIPERKKSIAAQTQILSSMLADYQDRIDQEA